MLILNSPQVVQEKLSQWKSEGSRIAFVPTMGCLHDGHLELIRRAKEVGNRSVASIFVNPLQFGPNEDFERYPRSFEADVEKLENRGVDLLFHPSARDLYPDNFDLKVSVGKLSQELCGKFRPGHFDGVATVCLKLFHITLADIAVFGEKDFQQLRIIQQLTQDFNLPLTILPVPIVREEDGLALSSRNRYLSPSERISSKEIPLSLEDAQRYARHQPQATVGEILSKVKSRLTAITDRIDYIEIASARDLQPLPTSEIVCNIMQPRLFLAVWIGNTRLIDNGSLNGVH